MSGSGNTSGLKSLAPFRSRNKNARGEAGAKQNIECNMTTAQTRAAVNAQPQARKGLRISQSGQLLSYGKPTLAPGMRFGRLVVTGYSERSKWICRCDCGRDTLVKTGKLTMGLTKSCGCFRKENTSRLKLVHGQSRVGHRTKTFDRWKGMRARCRDPKHKSYVNYGGRGISVCERWSDFRNFVADMGEAPEGMLLDRINNDGNYEPGNCRWVDPKQSANNRRPWTRRKAVAA